MPDLLNMTQQSGHVSFDATHSHFHCRSLRQCLCFVLGCAHRARLLARVLACWRQAVVAVAAARQAGVQQLVKVEKALSLDLLQSCLQAWKVCAENQLACQHVRCTCHGTLPCLLPCA